MKRGKFKKKSLMQRGKAEEENGVAGFGCLLPLKLLQHLVTMYYYNVSRMRNIQSSGTSAPCYVSIRTLKRLCKELHMFWANQLGRNCLLWRRSWSISEKQRWLLTAGLLLKCANQKGFSVSQKTMCIWHAVYCILSIIYCFYQVCSKESLFYGISTIYLILLWLYPGIVWTSEVSANLKL